MFKPDDIIVLNRNCALRRNIGLVGKVTQCSDERCYIIVLYDPDGLQRERVSMSINMYKCSYYHPRTNRKGIYMLRRD